jgi:predicted KAP-like P-loop ATPase
MTIKNRALVKIERFLEDLFGANSELFNGYIKSRLTIVIILGWIAIINYFQEYISKNIFSFLVLNKSCSSYWTDTIVSIVISILIMIQIRLLYNKYKPASTQYVPIILIWITYFFFRFDLNNIHIDAPKLFGTNHPVGYLDYLVIFSFLYFLLLLYCIYYYFFINNFKENAKNFFIEDLPINDLSEDEIGYSKIIDKLYINIVSDYYKKSFTVGIIGPWGNGKSSFVNALKDKIHINEPKVLEIEFQPYLNHNSSDIISEFFNLLSMKLSPYNGNLTEKLSDYSDKLLRLYKQGEIKSLFKNKFFTPEHKAAHELYKEIDEAIKQTDRPIIVYVDDLDRLRSDEILTVLKLIRNTANFSNTVFVVAMDKDFIISSLENEKIPESKRFVDKFFQLEIFLPQIEKRMLKDSFVRLINSKDDDIIPPYIKQKTIQSVNDRYCMFDQYIFNLRDIKRLFNQYIFEESILRDEVDNTDLLNFILLKAKFPKFIQMLYENRFDFFEETNGTIKLKEKKNGEKDTISYPKTIKNIDPNNFEISKMFENNNSEDLTENLSNLDSEEKKTLMNSMLILFSEFKPITHLSIRRTSIFYKLIRLNYRSEDFIEQDFQNFISKKYSRNDLQNELTNFKNANKMPLLLDRLGYFDPATISQFEICFLTYLDLLENKIDLNINANNIFLQFDKLYLNFSKNNNFNKEEFDKFCEENCFNDKIKLDTRIELLAQLWYSQDENEMWGFTKNQLFSLGTDLYNEYISTIQNGIFDLDFFDFYHKLKNIQNSKSESLQPTLNEIIKPYFQNEKAILTFAKLTLDNNGVGQVYQISSVIPEIFYSFDKYYKSIKDLKSTNEELVEYLKYLDLMQIIRFSHALKFVFTRFNPKKPILNQHINERRQKYLEEQSDRVINLFIKTTEEYMKLFISDNKFEYFIKKHHSQWYNIDDNCYFYLATSTDRQRDFIQDFISITEQTLNPTQNDSVVTFASNKFLKNDSEILSIYSVQPPSASINPISKT